MRQGMGNKKEGVGGAGEVKKEGVQEEKKKN
jgi:hypothetical protein